MKRWCAVAETLANTGRVWCANQDAASWTRQKFLNSKPWCDFDRNRSSRESDHNNVVAWPLDRWLWKPLHRLPRPYWRCMRAARRETTPRFDRYGIRGDAGGNKKETQIVWCWQWWGKYIPRENGIRYIGKSGNWKPQYRFNPSCPKSLVDCYKMSNFTRYIATMLMLHCSIIAM